MERETIEEISEGKRTVFVVLLIGGQEELDSFDSVSSTVVLLEVDGVETIEGLKVMKTT